MNGTIVKVLYKGKEMKVMVFHGSGKYKQSWLEDKAIKRLRVIEAEHPSLTLDEIQEQLDLAKL